MVLNYDVIILKCTILLLQKGNFKINHIYDKMLNVIKANFE